jgi:hypothetical protein
MTIRGGLKYVRRYHDQVAEPGVGPDELARHDDEEGEPEAERSATMMPGSAAGSTTPPHEVGARRAEGSPPRRKEHDVHPQHARCDADEHRKERRVRDEDDLRRSRRGRTTRGTTAGKASGGIGRRARSPAPA